MFSAVSGDWVEEGRSRPLWYCDMVGVGVGSMRNARSLLILGRNCRLKWGARGRRVWGHGSNTRGIHYSYQASVFSWIYVSVTNVFVCCMLLWQFPETLSEKIYTYIYLPVIFTEKCADLMLPFQTCFLIILMHVLKYK